MNVLSFQFSLKTDILLTPFFLFFNFLILNVLIYFGLL